MSGSKVLESEVLFKVAATLASALVSLTRFVGVVRSIVVRALRSAVARARSTGGLLLRITCWLMISASIGSRYGSSVLARADDSMAVATMVNVSRVFLI